MSDHNYKIKSFLGTGWGFPPTFHTSALQGVGMVKDEQDIKQSLEILLYTNPGERIMLPDYGSEIQKFLFASISTSKMHFLKEIIRTAIIKYEPRIILNEVLIDHSEYEDGIIRIKVAYTIKSNNTRFNLVFPYYKVEGTDIPGIYHKHVAQSVKNESRDR